MSIDYHGWIVLATSKDDWCDNDFDESFRRVSEAIQTLNVEDGHDPVMPKWKLLPQMVYCKGSEVDSITPVLRVVQEIGLIFDRAYGELLVFDDLGDQNHRWDFSLATRYRLTDGKVVRTLS
jgi:hypothetical protein